MTDIGPDRPADSSAASELQAFARRAGVIAHDFNNLLTSIRGLSSLVLQDLEPDHPIRPDLEEILRAAEDAAVLTSELLTRSREARNREAT